MARAEYARVTVTPPRPKPERAEVVWNTLVRKLADKMDVRKA